jgi:hypothetical protein
MWSPQGHRGMSASDAAYLCSIDLCAASHGHRNGNYCVCDAGYSNSTHDGTCSLNLCGVSGTPYWNSSSSLNYSCSCNFGYEFANGVNCTLHQNATTVMCVNGVLNATGCHCNLVSVAPSAARCGA